MVVLFKTSCMNYLVTWVILVTKLDKETDDRDEVIGNCGLVCVAWRNNLKREERASERATHENSLEGPVAWIKRFRTTVLFKVRIPRYL